MITLMIRTKDCHIVKRTRRTVLRLAEDRFFSCNGRRLREVKAKKKSNTGSDFCGVLCCSYVPA